MFESLRDAFRQAVDNFQSEVARDRIPEAADKLLRAMQSELVELQKQALELESHLAAVRSEAEGEHEAAKTCLRREEMALKIDDVETAEVARDFAAKHLRRSEILTEKADVLSRELADRRRNLQEMQDQFREARLRREGLAATAGRSEARDTIGATADLFSEIDRVAERIQDLEAEAGGAQELDEALGGAPDSQEGQVGEDDLDARLEALKRRMNES